MAASCCGAAFASVNAGRETDWSGGNGSPGRERPLRSGTRGELVDQDPLQAVKQDAPGGHSLPGRLGTLNRIPLLADDVQFSRAEHLALATSREFRVLGPIAVL